MCSLLSFQHCPRKAIKTVLTSVTKSEFADLKCSFCLAGKLDSENHVAQRGISLD
jgi:hypothetical protein